MSGAIRPLQYANDAEYSSIENATIWYQKVISLSDESDQEAVSEAKQFLENNKGGQVLPCAPRNIKPKHALIFINKAPRP